MAQQHETRIGVWDEVGRPWRMRVQDDGDEWKLLGCFAHWPVASLKVLQRSLRTLLSMQASERAVLARKALHLRDQSQGVNVRNTAVDQRRKGTPGAN